MEIQANLSDVRHVKNSEHFLPQPGIFCSGVAGTRKTPSGGSLNLSSIRVVLNSPHIPLYGSEYRQNTAFRVPPVSRVGSGEAYINYLYLSALDLTLGEI